MAAGTMEEGGAKASQCVQGTLSGGISGPDGCGLGAALDWQLGLVSFHRLHPMLWLPPYGPAFSFLFFLVSVSNFVSPSTASSSHAFFLWPPVTALVHCPWTSHGTCWACQAQCSGRPCPPFLVLALTAGPQGSHVCGGHPPRRLKLPLLGVKWNLF